MNDKNNELAADEKGDASDFERPVMCDCGKGNIVKTKDGGNSCTDTLKRYIEKHGPLPDCLTPISQVEL